MLFRQSDERLAPHICISDNQFCRFYNRSIEIQCFAIHNSLHSRIYTHLRSHYFGSVGNISNHNGCTSFTQISADKLPTVAGIGGAILCRLTLFSLASFSNDIVDYLLNQVHANNDKSGAERARSTEKDFRFFRRVFLVTDHKSQDSIFTVTSSSIIWILYSLFSVFYFSSDKPPFKNTDALVSCTGYCSSVGCSSRNNSTIKKNIKKNGIVLNTCSNNESSFGGLAPHLQPCRFHSFRSTKRRRRLLIASPVAITVCSESSRLTHKATTRTQPQHFLQN